MTRSKRPASEDSLRRRQEADEFSSDLANAGAQSQQGPQAKAHPAPGEAEDANQEAQRLADDLSQVKDRLLRSQAELENYRKRVRRETEDQQRYANFSLMRDLLPVVDNVQRAIDAADESSSAAALIEGFRMVAQQIADLMARYQVRRIEAQGQPFDPNFHEAIQTQARDDVAEQTVLHVAQEGYTYHDRVLRPAQVIVSTAQKKD